MWGKRHVFPLFPLVNYTHVRLFSRSQHSVGLAMRPMSGTTLDISYLCSQHGFVSPPPDVGSLTAERSEKMVAAVAIIMVEEDVLFRVAG